jgi:hypothetical protein
MRRGVWLVLALMGGVPAVALAQREVSNEVLQQQITELWQAVHQLQGDVAQLRERAEGREQTPAVGGSGRSEGTNGGAAQPGGTSPTGGSGQVGRAPREDTAGVIIVEQSAPGQPSGSTTAAQGNKPAWSNSAVGGSGMGPRPQASARRPDEQIFVGTLRSVTGNRLVMVDPSNRVYEFDVGARTRLIGPRGEAASPQALKQGMRVRAVTREAEVRNEVRSLQILGPAPVQ